MRFYEILWVLKRPSFKPYKPYPEPAGGRPAGRPNQSSVDRTVDRCARGRAQGLGFKAGRPTVTTQLSGSTGRPGDQPTRLSTFRLSRPGGRQVGEFAWGGRQGGRPVVQR